VVLVAVLDMPQVLVQELLARATVVVELGLLPMAVVAVVVLVSLVKT
jgi:hypothetical protein